MLSNAWKSARLRGLSLAVVCFGIAALSGDAFGQNLFDPYQPYASSYNSSSFPTLPNNLALPGQARDADEYERNSGGSRFNTFNRYLNESDDTPEAGTRRTGSGGSGGIGVPYYQAYRQSDRTFQREFKPNAAADRSFYAYEADKNRRYAAAMKEKDPVKRAKLLKAVSQMQMPREAASRNADPRITEKARPNASAPKPARTSAAEALAAEALAGDRAIGSAPPPSVPLRTESGRAVRAPSPSGRDAASEARRQGLRAPTRRPPSPSETPESGRPPARPE